MKIQLSTQQDIPKILEIIEDAKGYLASLNIDQWQNGYPNKEQIENDIKNNESYVVVNDENKIMATSMFTINPEPTYKIINGNWLIDESKTYGVIHRLAIKKEFRKLGLATFIFNEFHQQLKTKKITSLKIDTHEDNLGMQSLIKKLGYTYCGIIYTTYSAKRLAFEKVIS
ncbi:GNAT family N-acetyltransferase [Polaribacter sp.]|uniref:GNAT family N-acetyltransferase n=1 Tax=Polaribacter sp. TaxID=1920175 RepID=UPI003EF1303D